MSNYYDESVIEIMNSVNVFDVDVVRQLEEILTPQSSQRVSNEAKAKINQIASELKSFILLNTQESTTNDSEYKIENSSILCKMGIGQTSSQSQMKKSESGLLRSEQSTKDKSRAYREKKKLRNEQTERLLGQKIALNLNLKRRIELLEHARRVLRETIERKAY